MQVRMGEKTRPWAREQRMLQVKSHWYFVTREKTQEGPFNSLAEAEEELEFYIQQMRHRSIEASISGPDSAPEALVAGAAGPSNPSKNIYFG